jgi:hypothetical protein
MNKITHFSQMFLYKTKAKKCKNTAILYGLAALHNVLFTAIGSYQNPPPPPHFYFSYLPIILLWKSVNTPILPEKI